MVNKNFEVYKLKRELKRSGEDYEIRRQLKNEFGEPTEEYVVAGVIRGLYHETSEHILVSMTDTTQVRTKKVPSILCTYEDVELTKPMVGDRTMINGKSMKVTGMVNIQEWNLIIDISLEVVDDGN